MPYIGHNPTQAGSFVLLDDIDSGFDGSDVTFTLQIGGVDITPTADNLLIILDGVVQHSPEAYTVSGSTLTFTAAPADGQEFYGMLMGQSASVGQGSVGADELSVTGDGSANQLLSSDADGTMTWKDGSLSTTSATGDLIYRNSSGILARLAVGSAGQVLTVASGIPAWETDVESYLPLSGGTMSGALNMNSQNITNGGSIAGTFTGNLTGNVSGNVTGNTSGTAATVTGGAQTSITSLGTLTGLTVSSGSSSTTSTISADRNAYLNITATDVNNNGLAKITLSAGNAADSSSYSAIQYQNPNYSNTAGNRLLFQRGSGATVLTLDGSGDATFAGKVGIGTSTFGGNDLLNVVGTGNTEANFQAGSGNNFDMRFGDGTDRWALAYNGSNNAISFYNNAGGLHALTLSNTTGNATFAGNVDIGNAESGQHYMYINSLYSDGAGELRFRTGHPSNTNQWDMGKISVTDDSNYNGKIEFYTSTSGYNGTKNAGMSLALKLDSSQNATFGGTITSVGAITLGSTGSHSNQLFINSSNGTADIGMDDGYLRFRSSSGKNMIFMPGDAGTKVTFETDGTADFAGTASFRSNTTFAEYLKHDGDSDTFMRFVDNAIYFSAGNATALSLTSSGDAKIGNDLIMDAAQGTGRLIIEPTSGTNDFEAIRLKNDTHQVYLSVYRGGTERGRVATAYSDLTLHATNGGGVRVADDSYQGMRIADGGVATFDSDIKGPGQWEVVERIVLASDTTGSSGFGSNTCFASNDYVAFKLIIGWIQGTNDSTLLFRFSDASGTVDAAQYYGTSSWTHHGNTTYNANAIGAETEAMIWEHVWTDSVRGGVHGEIDIYNVSEPTISGTDCGRGGYYRPYMNGYLVGYDSSGSNAGYGRMTFDCRYNNEDTGANWKGFFIWNDGGNLRAKSHIIVLGLRA